MRHQPTKRTLHRLLWGLALCGLLGGASLAWPLPAAYTAPPAPVLTVTDAVGGVLRRVQPPGGGVPVTAHTLPPHVVDALVAVEDRRFYGHHGVDVRAVAAAAWANLRAGAVVRGGSTLTMQTARALRGRAHRGWWDKLAEAHLALRLELRWSKQDILACWLNRVPFGPRTFGVEAAAQQFFGKTAHDLNLAEAAFLVGLPQAPSRYSPYRAPERARARQRQVLAALHATGRLDDDAHARLIALPLRLAPPDHAFRAPHLVDRLLEEQRDLLAAAPGAVELRTTLRPDLQAHVEARLRTHLAHLRRAGVTQAAVVVLDNATGAVRAYVGSADFWDDRRGGQNDGVRMLRQPGSTLKPFTYALALAGGRWTAADILPDLPTQIPEAGGAFSPDNYDRRFHGPVSVRQALASSLNVPAVHLARALGPDHLLRALHRAGFTSLRRAPEVYGVGLTLGNGEVQLQELARAYAGLARGGTLPALRMVAWLRTADGDTLRPPDGPPASMGIDAAPLFVITDILRDPAARALAFGRGGPLELPFPVAVKTGTSKDYRDNWTVGYTPRHTVAVWTGNFDGAPMRWVSGVSGAAPLFRDVMLYLGAGGAFTPPHGLSQAVVCPGSGALPGAACPTRRTEHFLEGTAPSDTCTVHRRLWVDRRTGSRADAATPASQRTQRLFTDYPAAYHAWMDAQGLARPPDAPDVVPQAADGAPRFSERLRVTAPAPGTRYRLDPVLRPTHQQAALRAAVDPGITELTWWVDGAPLPDAHGLTAFWPLTAGRHEVEIRGRDRQGRTLRSAPIVLTVLPD